MAEEISPNKSGPLRGGSRYVLIVGSDANDQLYTSLLTQRFSCHVWSASTAEEALEMAGAVVPSLIVTDLQLGQVNALEMIQAFSYKNAAATVPFIVKSDKFTNQILQVCRKAGASACMQKPVQPEVLFRAVEAALAAAPQEPARSVGRLLVYLDDEPLDTAAGETATLLSSRGMFVRTLNCRPVKSKFPVRIILGQREIATEGKVVYSYAEGEGPNGDPGMGLYFPGIAPEDQERLQQYIDDEIARGSTP